VRVAKSKKLEASASSLYRGGLSIDDVARELAVSYRCARKAIQGGGAEIRNPSARTKGRTSPKGKKGNK
jgi:transposase